MLTMLYKFERNNHTLENILKPEPRKAMASHFCVATTIWTCDYNIYAVMGADKTSRLKSTVRMRMKFP